MSLKQNDNFYEHQEENKDVLSAARLLGKAGGSKTFALYGKKHFSEISKGWTKGKKRKGNKILEEVKE